MADRYMSPEQLRFLLYEVHELNGLLQAPRFQDFDRESIDMLLDTIKEFADNELYPYFKEMDEKPVRYENGKLIAHSQIGKIIAGAAEMGLLGATFDHKHGGMQMPDSVYAAAYHILESANNHVTGYPGLTAGAAKLIVSYGNQELIEAYVPQMLSGKWTGTMALTEPQAGSSLSDVTTTAWPTGTGDYKIKGQKIFISGGDQQFSENIVHLTLARIDGAPTGTKGISLFVIPRQRMTAEGALEYNDVLTAGEYQKLGQRGYATAHLVFGENDDCHGWLVGEPHRGLAYMFQMMNGARISVGMNATSVATAAFYASLQYAKERVQGRRLNNQGKKDPAQQQTPIIQHADIRRMLLLQKSVVEGSLSLLLQSTYYKDLLAVTDGEEREKYHLLLELLTPIAKTYPSEMGIFSVSNGLQILGGYGYCLDYSLQQYYRDIRIMSIYEGTTGIQALDLLGRKITMQNGKAVKLLAEEIQTTIPAASAFDDLKSYAETLSEKMALHQKVLQHLMSFAVKGEHESFLADATVYMEFAGIIAVAWQWLKMATVAKAALVSGKTEQSAEFYESKIHTMKFYYKYEVPKTLGLAQTLMDSELLTLAEGKELRTVN